MPTGYQHGCLDDTRPGPRCSGDGLLRRGRHGERRLRARPAARGRGPARPRPHPPARVRRPAAGRHGRRRRPRPARLARAGARRRSRRVPPLRLRRHGRAPRGVREAGVEHVVLLSASAADTGDLDNAVARYHLESEGAVRDSGVPFTILRPRTFMSNTLRWREQLAAGDVVREPFADVAVGTVDPADIAAVAVQAFLAEGHAGQTYRVTGPRAMLPAERLAVLGAALGRDLRLEPLSNEEARASSSAAMPPEYVGRVLPLLRRRHARRGDAVPDRARGDRPRARHVRAVGRRARGRVPLAPTPPAPAWRGTPWPAPPGCAGCARTA